MERISTELLISLRPRFSPSDIESLKLYYYLSIKYQDHINEKFMQEMTDHPVFGPLLTLQTPEQRKERTTYSNLLLYNAIFKGQWDEYNRDLIMQGIIYANMGMNFSAWYEVIAIVKDYYLPCILKEYFDSTEKMISTIHGMGKIMDYAMQGIAESFFIEKNRVIQQQQQRQTELIKELEDFAYIVSHDLKSPLRGIAKISEWLIMDYNDKLGSEGLKQLQLLKSRVQRLDDLIDGILNYSRLGRDEEKKEPVNVLDVIKDVTFTLVVPDNVIINLQDTFPVITCQRAKLNQVFSNLISNAIKYNDKDKCVITISCDEEKDKYKFTITDNGPGIEELYYEKIFKIFQTLQTRDEKESTGIGLSIVKKIIEGNGGKIWIESEPGNGTSFIFTIPKN